MYVCAAPLTSAQLVHLSCLDSFSTVLLHMVLGRLLFVIGYLQLDTHVIFTSITRALMASLAMFSTVFKT